MTAYRPKRGTAKSAGGFAEPAVPYDKRTIVREGSHGAIALQEARDAGLLDGERTEHVSFRAPRALVEAAQREAGVTSPTELGLIALALLAQPDPVAEFLKRTRGALGPDHELDY